MNKFSCFFKVSSGNNFIRRQTIHYFSSTNFSLIGIVFLFHISSIIVVLYFVNKLLGTTSILMFLNGVNVRLWPNVTRFDNH